MILSIWFNSWSSTRKGGDGWFMWGALSALRYQGTGSGQHAGPLDVVLVVVFNVVAVVGYGIRPADT